MPELTEAFLQWRQVNPVDRGDLPLTTPSLYPTSADGVPLDTDIPIANPATGPPTSCPDLPAREESLYNFDIDVFDLTTLVKTAHISCPPTMTSAARAIVLHGYVPTSPLRPSLAISLRSLELLRRIRLFHTSYSVEAFSKLICYNYKVSLSRY